MLCYNPQRFNLYYCNDIIGKMVHVSKWFCVTLRDGKNEHSPEMEMILIAILALAAGAGAGWVLASNRSRTKIASVTEDNNRLITMKETLSVRLENEQNNAKVQAKHYEDIIASERKQAAHLRSEDERRWADNIAALQSQIQKMTAEQLAAKQSSLQDSNRRQLDELLQPIKEQFAEFKKSVDESRTQNLLNRNQIQESFLSTMKLFQQQQQQMVSQLKEQTVKIGDDAANLTKALKGESKVQGDWGEMILESVLQNSGLRRDEEYFVQEVSKDEEGRNLRPDVVVKFPEGKSLVIDSKVSLTAYAGAVAAESDDERDRLMKEHLRSVRRHVDELAMKDYDKIVKDSIGLVLMFIPNESSYIAAMRQQPELLNYAYQRRIILISPSNLMMSLKLAYNSWQNDRQNKNVENIVRSAADLYDKVAVFSNRFADLEQLISRLSSSFAEIKGQLYTGKGNVMRRLEDLRDLGVTPKKQIKGLE